MSQNHFGQRIPAILEEGHVFSEDMARVLSLAFASGKNCLVFGPAGHAKSEMVQEVVLGLGLEEETFFQFFGEGMDEARLFGGLNFAKLETEKVLEYYPERSFLAYRVAVFEELFDAPANVLLALKDVLTARELRNGAQRFPMATEVIIVLTNKEPGEISELGPAAHALIERFPLQLELRWKDYSAGAYLALFEKVAPRLGGAYLNGFKAVLAEVLADATANGNFVSPRTAVHAYQVVQAAASLRGASEVSQEDLVDLRFVPGLEHLAETIEGDLRAAMERAEADRRLSEAERSFESLMRELDAAETPIKALVATKKLVAMQDSLATLRVPDGLHERRNALRTAIDQAVANGQRKALDTTRIDGQFSKTSTPQSEDVEDDEEFLGRRTLQKLGR